MPWSDHFLERTTGGEPAADVRVPVKRFVTVALLNAALLAIGASPAPAAGPYAIDAILSISGSGASLGRQEQAALGVLETVVNAGGGIGGRPIHVAVQDDRSDPTIAAHLTSTLIARHAPVVLGSTLAPACAAMAPLLERRGPLQYCFAPTLRGRPGKYAFSAGVSSDAVATVLLRYAREGGLMRIALMISTDAGGLDLEKRLDGALAQPESRDMHVLVREHFRPSDPNLAAQMARIKAANPEALVALATGAPLGTLLRAFHDSGMTVPISAPPGMVYAELARDAAFMPNRLYFAGTRGIVPDRGLGATPAQDAQNVYFHAFAAAGIRPDVATSLVWDPTMIVIEGLRKLGTRATAAQLHAYIEGLHLWAGINGLYDFRDNSQRGIGEDAMEVYHWNPTTGEFRVASRAAGFLR